MARFLVFVLVVASHLFAGFSTQLLPSPAHGNMISILSIDGGAIKGIIPAVVLDHLDKALKKKDQNADLAHYFDVIAGTSTGGLIAAMLASPSPHCPNRPLYTPAEILHFYKKYGPSIFNISQPGDGPEFDGKFLHHIIREILKETRFSETLTNVVIPTFDIKTKKPVIFSNYKLTLPLAYFNAKMSDICIAASAAPTLLPPYYFKNAGIDFNMADGGIAAGNPTLLALSEVLRHNKYTKMVVVSVGAGVTKVKEEYNVSTAATWNATQWIPLLEQEFSPRASTDMTESYLATFSALQPPFNYLRIQEYNLDPSIGGVNVTKENMDKLERAGKKLLKEKVSKMNVDDFELEETEITNAKALDCLADILFEERVMRLRRKFEEKREKPIIEAIGASFGRKEA